MTTITLFDISQYSRIFSLDSLPIRPVLIHIEYGEEKRIKTLKVLIYSEERCQK